MSLSCTLAHVADLIPHWVSYSEMGEREWDSRSQFWEFKWSLHKESLSFSSSVSCSGWFLNSRAEYEQPSLSHVAVFSKTLFIVPAIINVTEQSTEACEI